MMASTTSKPLKRLSLLQSVNTNALHDSCGSSSTSASKIESRKESSEVRGSDARARTISRPSPLRIHTASDMAHIAVIAGPSTAPLSHQTSPTSLNRSHRDYPSPDSPATDGLAHSAAKRAFARDKSTRRQSSICYISSTSASASIDASESSAAINQELPSRRSSKSISPSSATFARSVAGKRRSVIIDSSNQSLLRNEARVEDDQDVEVHVRADSSPAQDANGKLSPPLHDRQPMTLVEKHADLLHFIAQKESKCLELRAQLATHEAELLELKRKWEKIVSRGYVTPTTGSGLTGGSVTAAIHMAATPSHRTLSKHARSNTVAVRPASVIGAAGLREGFNGVGRLIAAGLGELAHAAPTPITILPQQQQEGDSDAASASTRSPAMSAATSARLSQSSISSFASENDAGGEKTEVQITEVQTTQNRIRVKGEDEAGFSRADRASGLTKPITPPSSHSYEKHPSLTPNELSATTAKATKAPISPTITAISTGTSGLRRRRSAGHKSATPPLSRNSPLSLKPISSNELNELHASSSQSPAKTSPSSTMSSLPPPSSLLGLTALGSLAMPSSSSPSLSSPSPSPSRASPATNSPLSSLPLTLPIPKRTVQTTVQTVHKRASAFLADASTSFFAALGSPQLANFGSLGTGGVPPPSSPSPPLRVNPGPSNSQMKAKKRLSLGVGMAVGAAVKSCASTTGGSATTRSLLDDDDEFSWNGDALGGRAVMVPDQPTKLITSTSNSSDASSSGKDDLTEEWPAWS